MDDEVAGGVDFQRLVGDLDVKAIEKVTIESDGRSWCFYFGATAIMSSAEVGA